MLQAIGCFALSGIYTAQERRVPYVVSLFQGVTRRRSAFCPDCGAGAPFVPTAAQERRVPYVVSLFQGVTRRRSAAFPMLFRSFRAHMDWRPMFATAREHLYVANLLKGHKKLYWQDSLIGKVTD